MDFNIILILVLVTVLSLILLAVAICTRRITSMFCCCCLICILPISFLYLVPLFCCSKRGLSFLSRHHNVKPTVIKRTYATSRSAIECCISITSCLYHNSPIGCNFRSNVTLNEAILRYQENEEFLNADLTKKIDEEKLLYVILYLINEINPKYFFTVLPTGSLRERLGKYLPSTSILATDYDLMLIPDGISVKVDDNMGSINEDFNSTPTLFQAVTGRNDIPPGYLWLKLTNDKLNHWNSLCFERLVDGGEVESYLSQLSIIKLIRRSIGDTIDVKYFASLLYDKTNVKASVERSGPAMTIKVTGDKKKENTCFKNVMEAPMELFHADFTFGLYCPQLPVCALEKLGQLSNANWPPREVIERIMHIGCHVVPKPSKSGLIKYGAEQKVDSHLSQGSALEFRYSFSQAELLMSDSLPGPARTVYMALKALIKFHINYKPDNWGNFHEIPSYVLKTLLFQTVETMPAEFWTSCNVLEVFFGNLYQSLVHVITSKRCFMYWNPEINLLSDFDDSAFTWILAKLETMSMRGLDQFLLDDWIEMQRCIRLNGCRSCIGGEVSTAEIEQDMRPCCCQRKVSCNDYDSCCNAEMFTKHSVFGGMKLDEEVFDAY